MTPFVMRYGRHGGILPKPTTRRPCLLCGGKAAHPIHGPVPLARGPRPTLRVYVTLYYFHAYDPGERRRDEGVE